MTVIASDTELGPKMGCISLLNELNSARLD